MFSRFGDYIAPYMMDEISRVDIDTELDFEIAEYLYKKHFQWGNCKK